MYFACFFSLTEGVVPQQFLCKAKDRVALQQVILFNGKGCACNGIYVEGAVQMMYFFQVAHCIICRLGKCDRQHRFEGIYHTVLEITEIISQQRGGSWSKAEWAHPIFSVLQRASVGQETSCQVSSCLMFERCSISVSA